MAGAEMGGKERTPPCCSCDVLSRLLLSNRDSCNCPGASPLKAQGGDTHHEMKFANLSPMPDMKSGLLQAKSGPSPDPSPPQGSLQLSREDQVWFPFCR